MITKEEIIKALDDNCQYIDSSIGNVLIEARFEKVADLILSKLQQRDIIKRKFAIEWLYNINYGIGSGTEYFDAETREEALKLFWDGKNREAFEVNSIYDCHQSTTH